MGHNIDLSLVMAHGSAQQRAWDLVDKGHGAVPTTIILGHSFGNYYFLDGLWGFISVQANGGTPIAIPAIVMDVDLGDSYAEYCGILNFDHVEIEVSLINDKMWTDYEYRVYSHRLNERASEPHIARYLRLATNDYRLALDSYEKCGVNCTINQYGREILDNEKPEGGTLWDL
jgi:hypothetical protein